jgi:propanediol dehydratase large subunit
MLIVLFDQNASGLIISVAKAGLLQRDLDSFDGGRQPMRGNGIVGVRPLRRRAIAAVQACGPIMR